MTSKYVGSFGRWDIHIATPEGGEYADPGAIRAIQQERYKLITRGRVKKNGNGTGDREPIKIFCTAINLDHERKLEESVFDWLPTTYHVFALGNERAGKYKGNLGCACAYTLESHDTVRGTIIGLPQENKVDNGYPRGFDLDPFREIYAYNDQPIKPGKMVELYRHFKSPTFVGDDTGGFGTYRAGIHEFVIDKLRAGEEPVSKWVFSSKPTYYKHLYRVFAAMLTPLLVEGVDNIDASPRMEALEAQPDDHTRDSGGLFYNVNGGVIPVSYRFPLIQSSGPDKEPTTEYYDFMSQLVDLDMTFDIMAEDKSFLRHRKQMPIVHSQAVWRIIGKNLYSEYDNKLDRGINKFLRKCLGCSPEIGWDGDDERVSFAQKYEEETPTLNELENGLFEGSL